MRAYCLCLALFACSSAYAAQEDPRIRRLSVEDGLSQSAVSCITQDSIGYLWIGTRDGLNRYDGKSFRVYRNISNDTSSLASNIIVDITTDSQNQMWVATERALNLYDPAKDIFQKYELPTTAINGLFTITDIIADDENIVAATSNGIYFFSLTKRRFERRPAYSIFDDQQVNRVGLDPRLGLIVLGRDGIFDKNLRAIYKFKGPPSERYAGRVCISKTGDIFFSKDTQIFKYNRLDSTVISFYELKKNQQVHEIKDNVDGGIWIGTDRIIRLDKHGKNTYELVHSPLDPFSLSGPDVSCTFRTRDGSVWIGTNGFGLNQIDRSLDRFHYYAHHPGLDFSLSYPYVSAIYSMDDTVVYVSTLPGGIDALNIYTKDKYRIVLPPDQRGNGVSTILGIKKLLVVGTYDGLFEQTTQDSRIFKQLPILQEHYVYVLQALSNDSVLVATNKGIYIYESRTWKLKFKYDFMQQLVHSYPVVFHEDVIWEASHGDLRTIDLSGKNDLKFSGIVAGKNLFSGGIKCLFKNTDGHTWIGTWGSGLVELDQDSKFVRQVNMSDGLPNDVVYGILEDSAGKLWMSTNKGLSCFDHVTDSIVNFSSEDGLQGDEFNTGAYYQSDQGRMYFGGTNGLTSFIPSAALSFSTNPPMPRLENVFIDDVATTITKNGLNAAMTQSTRRLSIDAQAKSFSFQASSISFVSGQAVVYRYKLEPFQTDWINTSDRDFINFTNIPPGNYKFHLQAAHVNGPWSKELIIAVDVHAPFWRNVWFVIASSASVVALAFFINTYRLKRLKDRTLELERIVADRTHEIETQNEELSSQSELMITQNEQLSNLKLELEDRVQQRTNELHAMNADLLSKNSRLEQFSFIIAHNLNGPVARIKGLINLMALGEAVTEIDTKLLDSVEDLEMVIRDLNDILNLMYGVEKSLEPVQLVDQVTSSLKILEHDIDKNGAIIRLNIDPELRVLASRPYLHSIFYNLVHNAIKYSKPSEPLLLTINAQKEENDVYVRVSDNGMGINMQYAQDKLFKMYQRFETKIPGRGLGLYLVKTQIEIMGGSVSIESTLGKGTTFTLRFLLP